MENVEPLSYIGDALLSVNEPDDLPGDVVVNATLINRMENNQDRATVVVELDSEERCNQILRKAKKRYAQDKRFEYYITPKPRRLHTRKISYSDEEIQAKAANKAKKRKADEITKKYKHLSKGIDKREKEPKQKHYGTPKAGTSKKPRVEPENTGPTYAVSTPLPSTSRIDPDTPVDILAELVRGVSGIVPVPRIDAPRSQERTLDTSEMDMAMTIEVENDLHNNENILENTTALIPEDNESTENDREECLKTEMDLVHDIESFKRRALKWSDDLRNKLRRRPGPSDLRNRHKDLRETLRRKSDPADLRYTRLNRNKDLRDLMRPRRRTSSVPPV